MPLGPRVMDGPIFQTLGASTIQALHDSDGAFWGVVQQIAGAAPGGLDDGYHAQVAPAVDALNAIDPHVDDATIVKVYAALDAVNGHAGALLAELPDPDAPDPDIEVPPVPNDPGPDRD